jgi:hypothetical protein
MTIYIKQDIKSAFKHNSKEKLYAMVGEAVKLVAVRGSVLLVERKDGYRFSVKQEHTTYNPNQTQKS